jgi:hypothetical protein
MVNAGPSDAPKSKSRRRKRRKEPVEELTRPRAVINAGKLIRLAFLAPDLQARILDGRQPRGLTLKALLRWDMPADWDAQRRTFDALH